MAGRALDSDFAAALVHDAVNRRESKAGAFPVLLGGEEGFEDVVQSFLVHARTVVGKRDTHKTSACAAHGSNRGRSHGRIEGADTDGATVGHGVARAGSEGHHNLVHLNRTHLYVAKAIFHLSCQASGL